MHATPDPVKPGHQYFRVLCIYLLCLISLVPSLQPTSFLQTFAKFLSPFFPVKSCPTAVHVSPPQTLSCRTLYCQLSIHFILLCYFQHLCFLCHIFAPLLCSGAVLNIFLCCTSVSYCIHQFSQNTYSVCNSNAHLYLTPCSLQSLSLDLLRKMTSSLAQNNTLLDLVLDCKDLTQKEDVKLFTHHFLLGLSTNTTLTDLSLSLPKQCWDWLQEGEVCGRFEGYYCSIVSKSK